MPNRGEYADAVRKRLEAKKRHEADTQKIQRVRESVVSPGTPGPNETVRVEGTGTVAGSGVEGVQLDRDRPTQVRPTGNPTDWGVSEDPQVVRVQLESETKTPKVKVLHKIARWIGKEGGESAMAEGPPYDWAKSVSKGAKSTSGTAIVLIAILGFARGMGIELWNPENDESAVVIIVGAISIVCGIWRGVSNFLKHRKNSG